MQDPDLASLAKTAILSGVLGLVGRAVHLARADKRPIGWSLAWELPIAWAMGFLGLALGDFFSLTSWVASGGLSITLAYIGPRVIDMAFDWVSKKYEITDKR